MAFNFFNLNKETKVEPKNDSENNLTESFFNFSTNHNLPKITESNQYDWISYGDNNDYPSYLEDLYSNSPTHQGIVDTKSLIVAGDSYTVDDTLISEEQKLLLNQMLNYIDGKNDIEHFITTIAKDFELYGAMAIEVIWSLDFTKIVKINRISPKYIRSGKFVDGNIEAYFYSRKWTDRKSEKIRIPSFDVNNKEDARQLLYIPLQLIQNEYYGEAQYFATRNWIDLEAQTGIYYRSLLDNGFNPSVIFKFYNKPKTVDAEEIIVKGLKKSFMGVKTNNKMVAVFSNNKETAPDIIPIEVSNIDKQFVIIAGQVSEKILIGHRITTPELFGISIPGQLGSGDFNVKIDAFTKFVIRPNQAVIERLINKLFKLNGLSINFKITPYTLTTNTNTNTNF